jgi:carbonic anhydrase
VQEAKEERGLKVHGWVYDVKTGRIKALDLDLDAEKEYYSTIKSDDYLIRQ